MKKLIILFSLFMIMLATSAYASKNFNENDLKRIGVAKVLLKDVEQRTLKQIAREMSNTDSPQEHLQIYEAIAKTYRDISRNYLKEKPYSQDKLLGKIQMNMAYFQLGGQDIERPGENMLNILIRRKLKEYLPKNIWGNSKIFYSLD